MKVDRRLKDRLERPDPDMPKRIVAQFARRLCLCLLLAASASAQNGRIVGSIFDAAGSGVPRAKVTVLNADTALQRVAEANNQGAYSFALLPSGRYDVYVSASGLVSTMRTGVRVHVGQSLRLDFILGGRAVSEGITVRVKDQSGSAVPGAKIRVVRIDTNTALDLETNVEGLYTAPNLPAAVYRVIVQKEGFATVTYEPVEVLPRMQARVDVVLQPRGVTEFVNVTNETPLLHMEDATTGQVIDNQKIIGLPLNGRNWLQLATLAPATVTIGSTVGNIGGLRSNQTYFFLDGADDTNLINGGAAFTPPIDALQEFTVETYFTADSAGFAGGVLNAAVKSGSNSYHGNAYEFLRNNVLNARNFFAVPTQKRPQLNRNQFGASIGAPFIRNKLFYFLNYDGTRQRQATTSSTTVFTDAQKTGDFSSAVGATSGTDALGRGIASGMIYDPSSLRKAPNGASVRDPFPGNVIPNGRINPVSRRLMAAVPAPELAGTLNYIRSISNPLDVDSFLGRMDWNSSSKDTVFGHVGYTSQWATTVCLFGAPLCGGSGLGGVNRADNRSATVGWTRLLGPTVINQLQAGFARTAQVRDLLGSNTDYNGEFGIPFPFQGPHMGSLAFLGIAGYTGLGGAATGGPYFQFVNKFELQDSMTVSRGTHSLKFGFNGRLKLFHNQWSSNYGHGSLNFTGVFTRLPGYANTGSSVADFLLGTANDASFGNIVHEKDIWRDIEWYGQDKWRVTSRLTLSYGLRFAHNPPSWEARDEVASVQVGLGYRNATIIVPKGMSEQTFDWVKNTLFSFMPVARATDRARYLTQAVHGAWAPRLGIAYQISPKLVLRTGYGIFYGFPENVFGNILGVNPPSRLVLSSVTDGITPTLFIDKAVFGSDPFHRTLTTPDFASVRDSYSPPEMTQKYNLSIQYQFLPNWLLEVGYMGNRGQHIYLNTPVNDATPALPTDTSSVQSRRIASSLLGNVSWYAPQGNSNYNALTLNVEKRFAGGFSVLANYTQSRALGNTDAGAQSPYNLRNSYGPLSFDVRGRLSLAALFDLPVGKGKKILGRAPAALDQIVGGWQVNLISVLQGGLRSTPSLTYSLGKTTTNSRPNCVADPTLGAARQPYQWINAAAFAIPANAEIAGGNFFGNCGAGVVASPGMVNFDVSVLKEFKVTERVRTQFRAESFNFANTPFLGTTGFGGVGSLSTTMGTPNFGKLTAAGDPRVIQLALKVNF